MKMKHDNLWRANPDTAEEMDEIERRRKRAMRTAITLPRPGRRRQRRRQRVLMRRPVPSKRGAAPAVQQSAPDDRGEQGRPAPMRTARSPPCPWTSPPIRPRQRGSTRMRCAPRSGRTARRRASRRLCAYVSAVLSFPSSTASSYLEVELLDSDGSKAADVGVAYSLDYGTCTVVPFESLTGGSEKPERIERGAMLYEARPAYEGAVAPIPSSAICPQP